MYRRTGAAEPADRGFPPTVWGVPVPIGWGLCGVVSGQLVCAGLAAKFIANGKNLACWFGDICLRWGSGVIWLRCDFRKGWLHRRDKRQRDTRGSSRCHRHIRASTPTCWRNPRRGIPCFHPWHPCRPPRDRHLGPVSTREVASTPPRPRRGSLRLCASGQIRLRTRRPWAAVLRSCA